MYKSLELITTVIFLMFVCLFFSLSDANAQDGICGVLVRLSAPGADVFGFVFEGDGPDGHFEFTASDGQSTGGTIPEGGTVTITEAPQNGYKLAGLFCKSQPGIVITNFDGGFSVQCVDASDGDANCVIRNVLADSSIPTLSGWGMIFTAAGLGIIGLFFALRRRRVVV